MKLATRGGLIRFIWLGLFCLLLTGCAVRFVYNQLDWLIPWYMDDYVDLDRQQERLLDERLEVYLEWHRRDQLPQYADFLEQVAAKAESGLNLADLETIEDATERFAQALMDRLLRDLMDLLATIDDQQVNQLFSRFARDNADFKREYVDESPQQQRKQRYKEAIHYVERWTGKLSSAQKKRIHDQVWQFELMGEELLAARQVWQQEFHRVLDLRRDSSAYETAFRQLISNPELGRTAELQRKLDHNRELAVQLYLQLDKSLSRDQRRHMVAKLRSYAEDFRQLSTQK